MWEVQQEGGGGGGSKVYIMSVGRALLKQPGVLKASSLVVCLGKTLFMRNCNAKTALNHMLFK